MNQAIRKGKKAVLLHKLHVLSHEFNESSETFWQRVYDVLVKRYGENVPRVYIHGDRVLTWIKVA